MSSASGPARSGDLASVATSDGAMTSGRASLRRVYLLGEFAIVVPQLLGRDQPCERQTEPGQLSRPLFTPVPPLVYPGRSWRMDRVHLPYCYPSEPWVFELTCWCAGEGVCATAEA